MKAKCRSRQIMLVLLITLVMATVCFPMTVFADDITIRYNYGDVETDTPPLLIDNRVFVPIRAISDQFYCKTYWDSKANQFRIDSPEKGLSWVFTIGETSVTVTDTTEARNYVNTVESDVAPFIYNNRAMVPIRFVSENILTDTLIGWIPNKLEVCMMSKGYWENVEGPEFYDYEYQNLMDAWNLVYSDPTMKKTYVSPIDAAAQKHEKQMEKANAIQIGDQAYVQCGFYKAIGTVVDIREDAINIQITGYTDILGIRTNYDDLDDLTKISIGSRGAYEGSTIWVSKTDVNRF